MVHQNSDKLVDLAVKLYEIQAFKFGDFLLKSGVRSPVYFDLRVIISYPDVLANLSELLVEFCKDLNLSYKHVCGVPYTALPIATLVSIKEMKPMLIRRKETKNYGTKKLIEGIFSAGDDCLIIEDVISSGSSVLETVRDLRKEGIIVKDAVVLVDREQGAMANITKHNVRVHSMFTLAALLNILKEAGKIESDIVKEVSKYIIDCQIKSTGNLSTEPATEICRTRMSFDKRADLATSPIGKMLLNLISAKKSNLCVAADFTKCADILNLANEIGPYICILKTHVDIIEDFDDKFIDSLMALAKTHNFLLMEDRKFADIGNTVALQYSKGIFKVSNWAHLVTSHSITGDGVLKGLQSVLNNKQDNGVFLLAELSSTGNLISPQYVEDTLKIATSSENCDFVAGIVCQTKSVLNVPGMIQLTPGVRIGDGTDEMGQQYNTPDYVIKEKGADIGVVGRGIIHAKDVKTAAILYRDQLWTAYNERINS